MRLCKNCKTPTESKKHYCSIQCHIRYFSIVDKLGHWIWTSAINERGYPIVKIGGKTMRAHRVSFAAFRHEFSYELEIDHLCKVRNCVNPNHLEPVTRLVNTRRGDSHKHGGGGRYWRNRTHCGNDHAYTPENTSYNARGHRVCRKCRADYWRRVQSLKRSSA